MPFDSHRIDLRPANESDAEFAFSVQEACMRKYATATFGWWDTERARASFSVFLDSIIQRDQTDIGIMSAWDEQDHLFLGKLYILPEYQNRGIGSVLLRRLIADADKPIKLAVLRVNPARRFYERHGFTVVEETNERYFMERAGGL